MTQCSHVRDAVRCSVDFGIDETGRCFHHSPARAAERAAARSRGGKAAGGRNRRVYRTVPSDQVPTAPTTIAQARDLASWALHAVLTGIIDPAIAREVAGLVREFCAAAKAADLERELATLRAQLAELRGRA